MPSANQRIGEYLLDQQIGRGAFGEVWRAHHHVWADQLVAIKMPTDPAYVRNLQREGVAVHGLVHPNIVRAIGFDPYADPPYLTMEYVPGSSLRPLIGRGKLSAEQSAAIMRQVLTGLGFAHKSGLIHRDIKPENVLVHQGAAEAGFKLEGAVKVTDFGLGQAAADTAVGSIAYSASLQGEKGREIAGTLDYMSPEQRTGAAIDGRSDLYACGVMLFEMLTGERPAGTDVPSDIDARVPKSLDVVFRRSYARLEKPYASADEFLHALNNVFPTIAPPPLPIQTTAHRPFPPAPSYQTACPHCRRPVEAGDQFCMNCGEQLVAEIRRCRKCGGYPDSGDRFCIFCGETLLAAAL